MKRLGKYEIVGVIGEGGMGSVYRARDSVIGRDVAIKVIQERVLNAPAMRERFYREAQAAGRLSHENIMVIHDIGEDEDTPYIVMEYLPGTDLRRVLDSDEAMSLDQKLHIAIQICEGLLYAHEHDVVHRDIKPDNIRILRGDRVKIMDFGIARLNADALTVTNTSIGTPRYMSPEQIKGVRVDNRSDIFSFGVVFYELITGTNPFWGDHVTAIIYKILHEDPEPIRVEDSELAGDLQPIVSRCLAKELNDRYQTLAPVLSDLRAAVLKRQVASHSTSVPAGGARDQTRADDAISTADVSPRTTPMAAGRSRKRSFVVPGIAALVVIAALAALAALFLPDRVRDDTGGVVVPVDKSDTGNPNLEDLLLSAQSRQSQMNEEKQRALSASASEATGTPFAAAAILEQSGLDALEAGGHSSLLQAEDAFNRAADLYSEAAIAAVGADAETLRSHAEESRDLAARARRGVAADRNDPAVSEQFLRADRAQSEGEAHLQQQEYDEAIRAFRQASSGFDEVGRVLEQVASQRESAEQAQTAMLASANRLTDARRQGDYAALFREADGLRELGSSQFAARDFENAATAFNAALDGYRGIAKSIQDASATADLAKRRGVAEQAQRDAHAARDKLDPSLHGDADFVRAADLVEQANGLLQSGSYEEATPVYGEAIAMFGELSGRPTGPAPEELARQSVQVLVQRLKNGFEREDLEALRAISPTFGTWQEFFGVAESITATVESSNLAVTGDRARVDMRIRLRYLDNKNRDQLTPELLQSWSLERRGDDWVVTNVDAKDGR